MMFPFELPPPAGSAISPEWIGNGFRLGEKVVSVLEYSENFAGWSDDLTALHEDAAGDSHPIDMASRSDALRQLRSNLRTQSDLCILEIGCSSGFLLKQLIVEFPDAVVVGADVVREPLFRLARELPSVPIMRFDLLQCPLPSDSCDAVVMLNVLEHIEDDSTALDQVHRILKPGGVAIVEVPAGPHLLDPYDRALNHFRRYAAVELRTKLERSGFSVSRLSHLGFFVYPAFAYVKRRNQRVKKSVDSNSLVAAQVSTTSSSRLLKMAFVIEHWLGLGLSYPVGIRCLATGRKRS